MIRHGDDVHALAIGKPGILVREHVKLAATRAQVAAAGSVGGDVSVTSDYIYRGLSMVDTTVILAGAVPAAALALVVDGSLLWLEKQLSARRRSRSSRTTSLAPSRHSVNRFAARAQSPSSPRIGRRAAFA